MTGSLNVRATDAPDKQSDSMDVGGREMADFGLQPASEKAMVSPASDQIQAKTTARKPVGRLAVERLCVGLLLYCPQVVPESAVHSAMTS